MAKRSPTTPTCVDERQNDANRDDNDNDNDNDNGNDNAAADDAPLASLASPRSPHLLVLGVAQDAGVPHIGCERACCRRAWRDASARRLPACAALVDGVGRRAWLLDATPAITAQWHALQRHGVRVAGVLLTHAHMGHVAGLLHVGREALGARRLPVYVAPRMRAFLSSSPPWSLLVAAGHMELHEFVTVAADNTTVARRDDADADADAEFDEVRLGPFAVRPVRVNHRDECSETVAFYARVVVDGAASCDDNDDNDDNDEMTTTTTTTTTTTLTTTTTTTPTTTTTTITTTTKNDAPPSIIWLPDLDSWHGWQRNVVDELRSVRAAAFVDGTFWSHAELGDHAVRDTSVVPHPPISHSLDALAALSTAERSRVRFVHLNHTNPCLLDDSPERRAVVDAGFRLAFEGECVEMA